MHDPLIAVLNQESTRRRAIRAAIGIATSALVWPIRSAGASEGWCRSDPVVSIDGHLADIVYDAPLDAPLKVTGPTQIVITIPPGVPGDLVLAGPGFGRGEQVSFANGDTAEDHPDHKGRNKGQNNGDGKEGGGGRKPTQSEKTNGGKNRKAKRRKNKRGSARKAMTRAETRPPDAGIEVQIAVLVPASEDMPVGVDFAPRLRRLMSPIRAEGTANSWITLTAKV